MRGRAASWDRGALSSCLVIAAQPVRRPETAGLLIVLAKALSPEGGCRHSQPVGTTKKHISSLMTERAIPE